MEEPKTTRWNIRRVTETMGYFAIGFVIGAVILAFIA